MFSKLKYWGLLDIFEKEEDKRMARIQLNIITFNCFLSLLVFFINLIMWQDQPLTIILIFGYVLHLILFVLVIKKHLPASSFLLAITYAVMVTTTATIGGGLHDYVVMMYPVIIMYAGLILQKRGLIFATLLSFAGLGWLVFGEVFGWFMITTSHIADPTDLLVSLILITLAAWMVYILVSNMEYGLTQTWRELAKRKRVEHELRKLTRAVEQSPASIVITDLDGNIEYVNPRFTQITGYGFDEAAGKNPRILKTDRTPPETHSQLWDSIAAGKEWHGEFVNRKKDGSLYYESAAISPITDWNGITTHYLAVKEDITERKKMEETMRESERFAHSIVDALSAQVVILDESGSIVAVNRVWRELAESTMPVPAAVCEGANYLAVCDATRGPDAVYARAIATGIRAVIHGVQTAFSLEYPCSAPIENDWFNAKVTRFAGDGPIRVVVAHEDITERKQTENALRESQTRFRALFNQNHDGVFIIGLDGKTKDANQRAAEMLQYSVEELQEGKDRDELAAPETSSENSFVRVLAGEHIPIFERMFRKKDGSVFPVEINLELVRDEDGTPLHVQSIVRDITERKQAEDALQKANEQLRVDMEKIEQLKEELREQAIHDPLTNLYNRRYLNETLPRELARVERDNNSLSVVISDIDHFKMINDTYGHPVGDKFLVNIASLMKKNARGSDIVCRYGGEEFLLVMPNTSLDAAAKHAEEIRQKCAEVIIQHEGKDLRITMSFGVATHPNHGKEAEEIIIKADAALYRAKAQGRNCTVVFE